MADEVARLQSILPSHYVVERELGRGGMATVYLAEDRRHHRHVAVKVLLPELATLVGRARFLREIEIEASLSHPGIIPLFDSGGEDECVWYVMPYVEGESLGDRLARERQLPMEEALRITRDVADALQFAHAHGVVHRDVKPGNVLLSGARALVADFGIARALAVAGGTQLSSSGLAVGTPPYMSPEQASGTDPVDGRSDEYSLACVVFEMLAGEPPFTGATSQAIFARHRLERPPSLEVVRPGVGRVVQAVVEKALAKVPADRYQTVGEFVVALEQAAKAPESGPYPPVPEPPAPAPWWKRPWVVGAAAVALVAGAALVSGWPLGPGPVLASNKVVGFPLRGLGGVTRAVTEQVYTVVENALVHTDPLKWVPGERHIAGGGVVPAIVSADIGADVARTQGSRWWITGTVTASGDSLAVALELYDAGGDSLVDRAVAAGPSSVPAYTLGLRAMNALLPRLVGRSTHVDQEVLAGFDPGAVAHWLEGEQAYREARYEAALAHYEQALALDSGMAFAALRGAMSAAWALDAEGYAKGRSLVRLALAHEDRLPRRNAYFAHGLAHLFGGDGDSSLAWFRRAVREDPDWSEGWYGVGEAYLHLAPSGRAQDSLARDAYERALARDPDFAPVAFHLAEIALLVGDRRAADSLMRRHARLSRDSAQLVTLDILRACTRSGPGSVAWAALAAKYPNEILDAARMMAGGARHPRCALRGFEAVLAFPGISWSAIVGVHHLALATGDTARALRFVDSLVEAGGRIGAGALGFNILDAVAGVADDDRAGPALAMLPMPLAEMTPIRLMWVGEWAAHVRDTLRLDSIAAILSMRARESGRAADEAFAAAMAAWQVLLRGDTATALSRFGALRVVSGVSELAFNYWPPLPVERLTYARLLAASREYRRATEVAASFDRGLSLVDLVFLPASLRLRRDAAQRSGEWASARALSRRVEELHGSLR